jgi:hypothetical protein
MTGREHVSLRTSIRGDLDLRCQHLWFELLTLVFSHLTAPGVCLLLQALKALGHLDMCIQRLLFRVYHAGCSAINAPLCLFVCCRG